VIHTIASEDQPHQCAVEHRHRLFTHHLLADVVERTGRQHARHDDTLVERLHDFLVGCFHEEGPDDGRDDGRASQYQRVLHGIGAELVDHQAAQHHGRDHGHGIGFEEVGGHAGAVTNVVTHVVRDDGRVARVVLGNASFHLADEVGADVRTLGEDAAAQSREDGDERATEGKTDQTVEILFIIGAQQLRGEHVEAGAAQKAKAHHQHAGHRTTAEGHGQRGGHAVMRGLRGPHIGAHRNVHADVTRGTREQGTGEEPEGGVLVQHGPQHRKEHHAHDADGGVLAVQVSRRPLLNCHCDFAHARVAFRLRQNPAHRPHAIGDGQEGAHHRESQIGHV